MDSWKEYLIRIVCAAILSACVSYLIPGKSTSSKLIRLLCSLYLTICIISPVAQIRISDFSNYLQQFDLDADAAVAEGREIADAQTAAIIKTNTEAYILDKASSLGLSIDVEVTVSDNSPPIPCGISLTGTASPIYKMQLQDWIEDELGIEKEHQEWN